MTYDHDFNRAFLRFQFQAEALLSLDCTPRRGPIL
jgi:hypothetical protein